MRVPWWMRGGIGGQTAIFHAVTQFTNRGLLVAITVQHGADLSVCAKLPDLMSGRMKSLTARLSVRSAFQTILITTKRGTVRFLREQRAIE
jgi:hypothetical protein